MDDFPNAVEFPKAASELNNSKLPADPRLLALKVAAGMRDEKTHNYTRWRAKSVICERVDCFEIGILFFFFPPHAERGWLRHDVFYTAPPFPGGGRGWSVIHGRFIAINAVGMSCACPRSPKGLPPSSHLADGTTDLSPRPEVLPSRLLQAPPSSYQQRRPAKQETAACWRREGDLSTKLPRLWALRQNFSFLPTNLSSITPHGLCTGAPRACAESANERAEGSPPPRRRRCASTSIR